MAHKGHPHCQFKSKAACDNAIREAIGKCTELTQDKKAPTQCARWGTGLVNGRAMCDMHAGMIIERESAVTRQAAKKQAMHERIDAYIRASGAIPHEETHDEFGCPDSHTHPTHECYPLCFYWAEPIELAAAA